MIKGRIRYAGGAESFQTVKTFLDGFVLKVDNKKSENRSFQTNCGGGEENLTPVRKSDSQAFSERVFQIGLALGN